MENCIETGQICPASNKKCKNCKLEECREVISMCEKQEKKKEARQKHLIEVQLPQKCRKCGLYTILNPEKQELYCSYMVKRCVLGGE